MLTLLALAYSNFKRVLAGRNLISRNLTTLAIVLALSGTVTVATYHRVWEKFTASEPPHGPARLSLSNPAIMQVGGFGAQFLIRLRDGFWTGAPSYGAMWVV